MASKLITRVLDAANDGANTSRDIAEKLGISVDTASAVISYLIASGLLRRTGRIIRNDRGKPFLCFEPCTASAVDGR